jgi:hypothetical protein
MSRFGTSRSITFRVFFVFHCFFKSFTLEQPVQSGFPYNIKSILLPNFQVKNHIQLKGYGFVNLVIQTPYVRNSWIHWQ